LDFKQISDDIDWVRSDFYPRTKSHFNVFVAGTGRAKDLDSVGIDLAIMAKMNHTILSYGTFSFWYSFCKG
jgi:hypothetical protein